MNDITIILTGTIKPNAIFTEFNDIEKRRKDYLKALKYYTKYAPVVFLENSEYDLLNDKEFSIIDNLTIYKMNPSKYYLKGKGFQEFEMFDAYIAQHLNMSKFFIKITGRYIIEDFEKILKECVYTSFDMIIDISKKRYWADTYLFFMKTNIYIKYFFNCYKEADDSKGIYIEHVFFKYIMKYNIKYRIFFYEYNILAVSGSTGKKYIMKSKIKILRRSIRRRYRFYLLKRNYLK